MSRIEFMPQWQLMIESNQATGEKAGGLRGDWQLGGGGRRGGGEHV